MYKATTGNVAAGIVLIKYIMQYKSYRFIPQKGDFGKIYVFSHKKMVPIGTI